MVGHYRLNENSNIRKGLRLLRICWRVPSLHSVH